MTDKEYELMGLRIKVAALHERHKHKDRYTKGIRVGIIIGSIVIVAHRWMPWFKVEHLDSWRWHWGTIPIGVVLVAFVIWLDNRDV